ncbi:FAD:protein FMN transferase [Sulfuricurvum sp.]|uniref:FAD:protein FMN transferase n=1 Tax=Sulfuricurvum sp. TaxID=2025608 RepID=UPI002613482C|nr:FAD:protein FMN transferase [Sulfuricurvum sp.]MDD4883834.1 FAD:protein FMN transferase [Sulfuricurvum sp.]
MDHYQFEAFSVPCDLHIDAPTASAANDAAKAVFENAKRLEQRYSFFISDSELSSLNNRSTDRHTLSDELAGLIRLALFYAEVTHGTFDIAMAGTLKELSRMTSLQEYFLRKEALIPFADSSHLNLDGNILTFSNPMTKIDLGGLVKEYAVDESIMILQTLGIESAMVNFGGDIAIIGTFHDQTWRVGIQDPNVPEKNLTEIELRNGALCTSGHSKRFSMVESKQISHIIAPSKKDDSHIQISIHAPTAVDAGIWSTALLIDPALIPPGHIEIVSAVR